jgi:hypothetical protein
MSACVIRSRREDLDDHCIDDESRAEEQMTTYLQGSTSDSIDRENTNSRPGESDDSVHGLEEEVSACGNTYLDEDLGREVLDRTDTCHLTVCLNRHHKDSTTQIWPSAKEIKVSDTFLGSLSGYLRLDQLELGQDLGIAQVVVCMQQRQNSKTRPYHHVLYQKVSKLGVGYLKSI